MKRRLPELDEALNILALNRTKKAPKPPPPVKSNLSSVLGPFEKQFKGAEMGMTPLRTHWVEIVGAHLGQVSEPSKIIKTKNTKTLEIRVGGAYAALLSHQSDHILNRVRFFLNDEAFDRIRFIQAPLTRNKTPQKVNLPPLDATEEWALRQSLERIEDEKIKNSLLQLGRFVLQKEKSTRP
jgi:hypothetical protein